MADEKTTAWGKFSSAFVLEPDARCGRPMRATDGRIQGDLYLAKEARAEHTGQLILVRLGIEKPERGGDAAQ